MLLDATLDDLAGLSVHGNGAGAVDKAAGLDGLAVDARERLGSRGGEDGGLLGGHGDGNGRPFFGE